MRMGRGRARAESEGDRARAEGASAVLPAATTRRSTAARLAVALVPALALALATGARSPVAGQEARDRAGARAVVERAVDLSGGEATLRGVRRVALRMMTQWQRPSFRELPYRDRPSYEAHTDVRDYTLPAWRNTREFGPRRITNIVRDSVAVTDLGQGFQPLSVAYVDEREELFTYTPDRLLLALLDAPDLRARPDTVLGGEPHRRVTATLSGRFPSTVYFHAGTGLPTLLRFRAGHPADFGLVPWGVMDVEVWYSGWRTFDTIAIPTQWDVTRVGEPYKRLSVQAADFAPDFASADSFAVSAELRETYWSSAAPIPMHEGRTIDERTMVTPGRASLAPPFGIPSGAVAVDDGWMLLGAGQAPFSWHQAIDALEELGVAPVTSVVVGEPRAANGGVRVAARAGLPVYVSTAAEPFVRAMLAEAGLSAGTLVVVDREMTLGSGEARVVLAPVHLPDAPGSLMLLRPATGWLYVPGARDPLALRMAREQAHALGWRLAEETDRAGSAAMPGIDLP